MLNLTHFTYLSLPKFCVNVTQDEYVTIEININIM